MSQISLKMCARRAVRVTSVFSSAAASLRVRTDRDVCRAENCVRNTSGNKAQEFLNYTSNFSNISFILNFRFLIIQQQNKWEWDGILAFYSQHHT